MTAHRDALAKRILDLELRRTKLMNQLGAINEQYNTLTTEARNLFPPFSVGDVVTNSRGVRVQIMALDKAFGGWVAQVVFLKPGEEVETAKRYTYMAQDLEPSDA